MIFNVGVMYFKIENFVINVVSFLTGRQLIVLIPRDQ